MSEKISLDSSENNSKICEVNLGIVRGKSILILTAKSYKIS